LFALWQFVGSQQAFQSNMIAEAARTNEKLSQIQIDQTVIKGQLDRMERQMAGGTP